MTHAFKPASIITITTDLGHKGPFVATMKGVMLRVCPEVRIIDLTHDVFPHWPTEVAFWLGQAYPYFPSGTVHAAMVDPGGASGRDLVVGLLDGHAFIGPDNGQLTALLERPGAIAHKIEPSRLADFGVHSPSATFQGRDVIAPLAAQLAAGTIEVAQLGPRAEELVPAWVEEPQITAGSVQGMVVTMDAFGNLFSNIEARHLQGLPGAVVTIGGRTIPMANTYGDVEPGEYLALINSFGVLEIARAQQSAAEGLGVERGAPIVVRRG